MTIEEWNIPSLHQISQSVLGEAESRSNHLSHGSNRRQHKVSPSIHHSTPLLLELLGDHRLSIHLRELGWLSAFSYSPEESPLGISTLGLVGSILGPQGCYDISVVSWNLWYLLDDYYIGLCFVFVITFNLVYVIYYTLWPIIFSLEFSSCA